MVSAKQLRWSSKGGEASPLPQRASSPPKMWRSGTGDRMSRTVIAARGAASVMQRFRGSRSRKKAGRGKEEEEEGQPGRSERGAAGASESAPGSGAGGAGLLEA